MQLILTFFFFFFFCKLLEDMFDVGLVFSVLTGLLSYNVFYLFTYFFYLYEVLNLQLHVYMCKLFAEVLFTG